MNNQLKFIVYFFIVLHLSCKTKNNNSSILEKSIELEYELHLKTTKVYNFNYYNNGHDDFFTYVDSSFNNLFFYNLKKKEVDSVSLQSLNKIQPLKGSFNYFVKNIDSIFVLLDGINVIYLLQKDGDIKNQWHINKVLENDNRQYDLLSLPKIPLFFQNNCIYVMNARTDIIVNNPKARNVYYHSIPEVVIDISDPIYNIKNQTGKWPKIYKSDKNYLSFWPSRCIDSENKIVYSFDIDPNLYIYKNDSLIMIKNAESSIVNDIRDYPDDSTFNMLYKKKYWLKEPRYEGIIYDNFHNLYYRIISHSISIEKEDGTLNSFSDKPFSIMIINAEFDVIGEVRFDSNEYNSYYIFPTKEGLLINKRLPSDTPGNIKKFTLYKLSNAL